MARLIFPTEAEAMETGEAISVVNTGYLPFIPFTTQYKMGMAQGNTDFLVPTQVKLGEIGKRGTADWAWKPVGHGGSFQPNIDRYNQARMEQHSMQDGDTDFFGNSYGTKDNEYTPYGPEKYQQRPLRGKEATDQMMEDLRFAPNATAAAASSAMGAELANIITNLTAPQSTSQKEKAEMEEEAILDVLLDSGGKYPELDAIMQEARQKAIDGETSAFDMEFRNKHGLSKETYDWSIKDLEDLTKMHALITVMNQEIHGDLLSDNIIGLEVTKDKKFLAVGWEMEKYEGNDEEQREKFLTETRSFMKEKFTAINNLIKKYSAAVGHMRDDMVKYSGEQGWLKKDKGSGNWKVEPHEVTGFTIQLISRAREAILHPSQVGGDKKDNTFAFEFPMGGKEQGGPYIVSLEIVPVWTQDNELISLDHRVGIVDMGGATYPKGQPGVANMLLKHFQDTLKLSDFTVQEILAEAAIIYGTEMQIMSDRADQLGSRFLHDFGMFMGNTYIAYTTMTATMTNKEISDALFALIQQNAGNPQQIKAIQDLMQNMFNDSTDLTQIWKDKVGGNDYTVDQGYVYAKSGGPWQGDAGEGTAMVPFIGSSRQQNLIMALQSQKRKGSAVKNVMRRRLAMSELGDKVSGSAAEQEILFGPEAHQKTRGWMQKAFDTNPSTRGFEQETGVISVRQSWLTKHMRRNIEEFDPYIHKI